MKIKTYFTALKYAIRERDSANLKGCGRKADRLKSHIEKIEKHILTVASWQTR